MIRYSCKKFDDLSLIELYEIMKLRQEVFVVEQNCPYLDADDKDLYGYHVMGKDKKNAVVCCTRLLPEGVSYEGFISIGRVANGSTVRGTGEGKKLMDYSIETIKQLYPASSIKIGAQTYLKRFYENLGFKDLNQPYLEDGIPHIIMVYEVT
ncbi:MAG: GNAT family N-acetyltransferase [Saprospiraceae bacterium]|jgi:ElaA protein|nr:GNAT family N-acetyltransferase [Saprospiraceae bacterium]MBK9564993.1 GNAT family N-acetyltransferase [Saprospiraceae bacterium]MBP6445490.1 GNAT family N-acetyltransferase [Saprospiraceae bacterium]